MKAAWLMLVNVLRISLARIDCHFAKQYNTTELFEFEHLQEKFLLQASWWEGVFARDGIGVSYDNAIANLEITIDRKTGLPSGAQTFLLDQFGLSYSSGPDSEGVHLSLLAAALDGSKYARQFFRSSKWIGWKTKDYIIDQLKKKLAHYRDFHQGYPGYGGWLPTFAMRGQVEYRRMESRRKALDGLENGYFCWGIVAAAQALNDSGYFELAQGYFDYVNLLARTGLMIFYHDYGTYHGILTLSTILNIYANATTENYSPPNECNAEKPCTEAGPWNFEALFMFLYLYSDWTD